LQIDENKVKYKEETELNEIILPEYKTKLKEALNRYELHTNENLRNIATRIMTEAKKL
jgi:hypothetical protein